MATRLHGDGAWMLRIILRQVGKVARQLERFSRIRSTMAGRSAGWDRVFKAIHLEMWVAKWGFR